MDERDQSTPARIEAVCRTIEDRLAEEPTLDELAASADLSPFHFHRLFRGIVGETVAGYQRRLRLERAAHRIEHGEGDLLTVALDAGYASHEAFTRAFGKRFGQAPSEYRAKVKEETKEEIHGAVPGEDLDVRIESLEPDVVAFVRHVGPYSGVGEAWKALMKWGWSKTLFGSATTFGLCHDDPDVTDPERLRYDACMTVRAGTRVRGKVALKELPGGTFAVTTHHGDYTSIGRTYAALFARIVTQGVGGKTYRLGDPPSREIYLNDPRKTRPADLITEVWMPVESIPAE